MASTTDGKPHKYEGISKEINSPTGEDKLLLPSSPENSMVDMGSEVQTAASDIKLPLSPSPSDLRSTSSPFSAPSQHSKAAQATKGREQEQPKPYLAALTSLAMLLRKKNIPIPHGEYVSGTTEDWKHGNTDEMNISAALMKNLHLNAAAIAASRIREQSLGVNEATVKKHAHTLATTGDDDSEKIITPTPAKQELLRVLAGARSRLQKAEKQDLLELVVESLMNLRNTSTQGITPLAALSTYLTTMFSLPDRKYRLVTAGAIWHNMINSLGSDGSKLVSCDAELCNYTNNWDHWGDILSLIMVSASKKEDMRNMLAWIEACDSSDEIEKAREESGEHRGADLLRVWEFAKSQAEAGKTTVIGVKLLDVNWLKALEERQRGEQIQYSTFEHGFVLGVGPDGVVVWQAWGRAGACAGDTIKDGYALDEWMENGRAEVRSFLEGEEFVGAWGRLMATKGTGWNAKRNRYYKQAFDIDLKQLCGEGKTRKPLVPHFDPWVDIRIVKDMKAEDVSTFVFEGFEELADDADDEKSDGDDEIEDGSEIDEERDEGGAFSEEDLSDGTIADGETVSQSGDEDSRAGDVEDVSQPNDTDTPHYGETAIELDAEDHGSTQAVEVEAAAAEHTEMINGKGDSDAVEGNEN